MNFQILRMIKKSQKKKDVLYDSIYILFICNRKCKLICCNRKQIVGFLVITGAEAHNGQRREIPVQNGEKWKVKRSHWSIMVLKSNWEMLDFS